MRRVRIAVAVARDGKAVAVGMDALRVNGKEGYADPERWLGEWGYLDDESFTAGTRYSFVEAWVPEPEEPATVEGTVHPAPEPGGGGAEGGR